jgi:hypothetical protein
MGSDKKEIVLGGQCTTAAKRVRFAATAGDDVTESTAAILRASTGTQLGYVKKM